jgi:hypothetical protein
MPVYPSSDVLADKDRRRALNPESIRGHHTSFSKFYMMSPEFHVSCKKLSMVSSEPLR